MSINISKLTSALFAASIVLSIGATTLATSASAQSGPKVESDFSKQPAGDYILDRGHTSVVWRVKHFGLSNYTARFDKMDAKLSLKPASAEVSSVEFTIDATSVNTGLAPFDKELQNADYFSAEKNPKISFKSTKIESVGGNKYRVTGDMIMRGVTKPITWDVSFYGGLYNSYMQGHVVGFSAKGIVKRSDWGLVKHAGIVGEDVEVQVESEFVNRTMPQ